MIETNKRLGIECEPIKEESKNFIRVGKSGKGIWKNC